METQYRIYLSLLIWIVLCTISVEAQQRSHLPRAVVSYNTIKIEGVDIFYRSAGDPKKPAILLLHGFPASSHMFRDLIPQLAGKYYLVAPDYPGFGQSSMPEVKAFNYTFDNLALVIEKFTRSIGLNGYTLYIQDYGAPVGFRLAVRHPERVEGLIIQNGNAYEDGLGEFWGPVRAYWNERNEKNVENVASILTAEGTKWQYTQGAINKNHISPDAWTIDQTFLDRPGNRDIQLQLFYDYRTNPPMYRTWQEYFRKHQPPALVVWGKNDPIFKVEGAYAYKRDLRNLEFHLLDAGHFALEEQSGAIASLIDAFLSKRRRTAKDR